MRSSGASIGHGPAIVAVIVLYQMRAEDSPAFRSLTQLLSERTSAGVRIEVVLCDNSSAEQAAPLGFGGQYLRNPSNPGLARCYNQAVQIADDTGASWLLLLDQDTTVTATYLDQLMAALEQIASHPNLAAVIPRLSDGGILCSPMIPSSYGPDRAVGESTGFALEKLNVLNSGAVVRVSAVRSIGGFPEDFPLDYLDHATFTDLQRRGGKLYLIAATLDHHLSSNDDSRQDERAERRQESVLDAEFRFYNRYGTAGDRMQRRWKLLRACAGRVLRGKNGGQTWRMLKSALRP